MFQKTLLAVTATVVLSGCQISTNALNPKYGSYNHILNKPNDVHCKSVGCGKDLSFYPMARGEADRRAKACGWDWGETSSAYHPSTDEYKKLRAEEEARGQVPGLCQ